MLRELNFKLNGRPVKLLVKPTATLLDCLRDYLNIMSPKRGCEEGDCGACTVLIDGKAMNSCLVLGLTVEGREVITLEGILDSDEFGKLRDSFFQRHASQCGFCTPGMIMAAYCFLKSSPGPSRDSVLRAISGNLCRCTGYESIIEAIMDAAAQVRGAAG